MANEEEDIDIPLLEIKIVMNRNIMRKNYLIVQN